MWWRRSGEKHAQHFAAGNLDRLPREGWLAAVAELPRVGPLGGSLSAQATAQIGQIAATELSTERGRLAGALLARIQFDQANYADAFTGTAIALIPLLGATARSERAAKACLFGTLGRVFLNYGSWETACEFYYHAAVAGTNGPMLRHYVDVCLIASQLGDDLEIAHDILAQALDSRASIAGLRNLLGVMEGTSPCGDADRALTRLAECSLEDPLSNLLVGLLLARKYNGNNASRQVFDLVSHLTALTGIAAEPWLFGYIAQEGSVAALRLGYLEHALDWAMIAMKQGLRLKFGRQDVQLRQSGWETFEPAVTVAHEAAFLLDRPATLAQVMEASRINARLKGEILCESEEVHVPEAAPAWPEPKSSGALTAPQALFAAMTNSLNAADIVQESELWTDVLATLAPNEHRFGVARVAGFVYSYHAYGSEIRARRLDLLDDEELAEVLEVFSRDFLGKPSAKNSINVHYGLAEWHTPDERKLSSAIGRLLPPSLQNELRQSTHPLTLSIAAAGEMAVIPWPVAQIEGLEPDTRLIEVANLQVWASGSVWRAKRANMWRSMEMDPLRSRDKAVRPALLVLDDPRDTMAAPAHALRHLADHYLGHHLASGGASPKQVVLEFLRAYAEAPRSIFYYRGHAYHGIDPALAVLEMPDCGSAAEDEQGLSASEISASFSDGTAWLKLPQTVVLSCCSSVNSQLMDGASLGVAASCIVGGGSLDVIATTIDVYDTEYSARFDARLCSALVASGSPGESLWRLQREALVEWKAASVHPEMVLDAHHPHPLVWAMYVLI